LKIPLRPTAGKARESAAAFLKNRGVSGQAPSPPGARQRDRDRPHRCRSRCRGSGTPRRDPAAEGGRRSVGHPPDAKLSAREAIAGLAEGHVKILAQAIETAAGLFAAGNFRGSSARLIGLTWGPEDLSAEIGSEANRDAQGELTEPYRLARSVCLFAAAAAGVAAIETIHVDFRNLGEPQRDTEKARRRRLHRPARDSSRAGAGVQRGVHADHR
jgi:hypothetical protein